MADNEALRLADALRDGTYLLSQERNATEAELRRQHALLQEWEAKAATWLASPEAAQRLDGYRELAQRANRAEAEREALLALIADDAFASSFQTMAQYRSALLKATKGGGNG